MAKEKVNQNIIINSYEFTHQDKDGVTGKRGYSIVEGSLKITKEAPEAQVRWAPKVAIPAYIPFKIKHPVFRNTTYILEDLRIKKDTKKTTLLEYLLVSRRIVK